MRSLILASLALSFYAIEPYSYLLDFNGNVTAYRSAIECVTRGQQLAIDAEERAIVERATVTIDWNCYAK